MRRSRLVIGAFLGLAMIVVAFFLWRNAALTEPRDKGLKLAREGEFQEAEPALKRSLAHNPADVDVLRALAKGYLAADRKADADESLSLWLAQLPDETEPLLLRIELYRELGKFDQALLDLNRLLEIDAGNLAWRRKRVALLYSASRFDEAEIECQRSLQKQPADRGLQRTLAEINRAQRKLAEAGVILDAILRDSPQDTATMAARAILHLAQDEPEKSIPLLRKVLELDPNRQHSGRYYLGLALNRVGQTDEAERLLEEVRRRHDATLLLVDSEGQPNNLPLQVRAARAQFENNDLRKSTEILRKVLRDNNGYAPAHVLLADVLEKDGRFDQAAEHRRWAKGKP